MYGSWWAWVHDGTGPLSWCLGRDVDFHLAHRSCLVSRWWEVMVCATDVDGCEEQQTGWVATSASSLPLMLTWLGTHFYSTGCCSLAVWESMDRLMVMWWEIEGEVRTQMTLRLSECKMMRPSGATQMCYSVSLMVNGSVWALEAGPWTLEVVGLHWAPDILLGLVSLLGGSWLGQV